MSGTVCLMYHELEVPDRTLCDYDAGYLRYVLKAEDFERQMQWLKSQDWRGISLTEALDLPSARTVVLTFDDGCESDVLTAAPLLKQLGFGATFYITVGRIGKPGYLSAPQVRDLCHLGFELGCHSMTHAYLPDLSLAELSDEVALAKIRLQQVAGCRVDHFSCPGGRYDWRVVRLVKEIGYRSMATSRVGTNHPESDRFALTRLPVVRDTNLAAFKRLSQGRGLWKFRAVDLTRLAAKNILGDERYDRWRSKLLAR